MKRDGRCFTPNPLIPFFHHNPLHLFEGEIRVGYKVVNAAILGVDKVKHIPLHIVLCVVFVTVDSRAEILGHISQLMCLVPKVAH